MQQSTGVRHLPEEIIIDGMEEHAFRRSIEIMLRNGRADEAVTRLKALIPECAGEGKTLPARLLEIGPQDIHLAGWDKLAGKITEYSRPSIPITAIGIGIGDPEDLGLEPDALGNLKPPLATSFYSDATFPFSETDRADLLEGYTAFGCEWQGDHDRIDDTLSIEGIDDLYGAIVRLENAVAASGKPDPDLIRSGAIGACYLGVMVWQAARRAVIEQGLPRPLAILLVNSDAYPFFDAPVMTCDEYLDDGAIQIVDHESACIADETEVEEQEAASLIAITGLGAHRKTSKKMALMLEGAEAHNPLGMADELVAQAAFEPSSVDISRFMPDASEFRNEPDPYEELEEAAEFQPEPENEAEAADAREPIEEPDFWQTSEPRAETDIREAAFVVDAFDEAEFPVETTTAFPDVGYPTHEPAAAESANEEIAEADADPLPEFHDDKPAAPSSWSVPDWAMSDFAPGQSASNSGIAHDADEPSARETSDTWQDHDVDPAFPAQAAPAPVSSQPASHSIRARIRATPIEEPVEAKSQGLFAAIVRLFRRNRI